MRFIFAYAGIPAAVYDAIYQARARFLGTNADYVGRSLWPRGSQYLYSEADVNFFENAFWQTLVADHHNRLSSTCFAMISVAHDADNQAEFTNRFFPAVFTASVEWRFDNSSEHRRHTSTNSLLRELQTVSAQVKAALRLIADEVRYRDNRTPLLLPVRNFSSRQLSEELKKVQRALTGVVDKAAALQSSVRRIEACHPRQKISGKPRPVFVDENGIEFTPPGSMRHGFARPNTEHPQSCFIAGRRRLGAPYDSAFHYDCTKGGRVLSAQLFGCHEDRRLCTGTPHLNIAPNDHVR